MFLNDDLECAVCCNEFSRSDRIPRVLHCNHTFCASCLERLCVTDGIICSVCCPLCRWITCTRASLTLPGALWVNTDIWDQIGEEQQGAKFDLEETKAQLIKSRVRCSKPSGFMPTLQKLFSCVLLPGHDMHRC